MPIYTYRCKNCGVQFEVQQSFTDQPLTRCPECSKKTLQKVYQPVGIVFKGSGFYATDHRSPSGSSRASGKEKEKSGEGEGKSEGEKKNESAAPASPAKSESSSKE
ncbi:MAG: zinc ribbon domain-containing protein [Anaerolineales bacterium]|nr:zinc ribbon domain-containing protein [Anaerolineales bacterium]